MHLFIGAPRWHGAYLNERQVNQSIQHLFRFSFAFKLKRERKNKNQMAHYSDSYARTATGTIEIVVEA